MAAAPLRPGLVPVPLEPGPVPPAPAAASLAAASLADARSLPGPAVASLADAAEKEVSMHMDRETVDGGSGGANLCVDSGDSVEAMHQKWRDAIAAREARKASLAANGVRIQVLKLHPVTAGQMVPRSIPMPDATDAQWTERQDHRMHSIAAMKRCWYYDEAVRAGVSGDVRALLR